MLRFQTESLWQADLEKTSRSHVGFSLAPIVSSSDADGSCDGADVPVLWKGPVQWVAAERQCDIRHNGIRPVSAIISEQLKADGPPVLFGAADLFQTSEFLWLINGRQC